MAKAKGRWVADNVILGNISGFRTRTHPTNPAYQLQIEPGACRNSADDDNIESASNLTADITVSGANGLDTGSEASSTWYYAYVINNRRTRATASLLSLSDTSPTLPSGYDRYRRVGAVYNNASSNFREFRQEGSGKYRTILYDEAGNVLTGGTATTWTDVDLSGAIPASSSLATIEAEASSAGSVCRIHLRGDGITSIHQHQVRGYNLVRCALQIGTNRTNRRIEYQMDSGDSGEICVTGYVEEV